MARSLVNLVAGFVIAIVSAAPLRAMPITIPQDIVFLMDASSSISHSDFVLETQFLSNLISGLSPQLTRSGLIDFGTNVFTRATLDNPQSAVLSALANIAQIGGQTNTIGAIQAGISQFNTFSNPINPKLMVLLTDGVPNFPTGASNVCQTAGTLSSLGIQTLIIGVGSAFSAAPVSCLVQSTDDIFSLANFASASSLLQNQVFLNHFTQGYEIPDNTSVPLPGTAANIILGLFVLTGLRRKIQKSLCA